MKCLQGSDGGIKRWDLRAQVLYERQPTASALTHHSGGSSQYVCMPEGLDQAGMRPSVGKYRRQLRQRTGQDTIDFNRRPPANSGVSINAPFGVFR